MYNMSFFSNFHGLSVLVLLYRVVYKKLATKSHQTFTLRSNFASIELQTLSQDLKDVTELCCEC